MKITAQDMLRFGVIDDDPEGAVRRCPSRSAAMIAATGDAIAEAFDELRNLDRELASASSGGRNSSISAASWADFSASSRA